MAVFGGGQFLFLLCNLCGQSGRLGITSDRISASTPKHIYNIRISIVSCGCEIIQAFLKT